MTLLTRIEVPEGSLWTLISDNGNISLFDNTIDDIPEITSEVILEPSNDNYERIRGESEKVMGEEGDTNRTIVLTFENTFLASDVYLQHRVFTNKNGERFEEPHAYIAKMDNGSFISLAEGSMMRHLEILFASLLADDLREKHNYVVSNFVDAKYHEDRNSVSLESFKEEFSPIFVDAFQARLILDKIS